MNKFKFAKPSSVLSTIINIIPECKNVNASRYLGFFTFFNNIFFYSAVKEYFSVNNDF